MLQFDLFIEVFLTQGTQVLARTLRMLRQDVGSNLHLAGVAVVTVGTYVYLILAAAAVRCA